MATIEVLVNIQSANHISEETLSRLISEQTFDKQYAMQIFNLFTEVPATFLVRFIKENGIKETVFKKYYETHIKPIYPNKEIEELLAYVGKPV